MEVLRLEVQLHNTRKDKEKLLVDLENVELNVASDGGETCKTTTWRATWMGWRCS